jgi:hypothetical protein
MVGFQKAFFARCVSDDFGDQVVDFQNFMEIMSFLGQKEGEQLGIIFNYFVDLAI